MTNAENTSLRDELLQRKPVNDKKLSKPQLLLRWPMLVLICLLMVCTFFYYDHLIAFHVLEMYAIICVFLLSRLAIFTFMTIRLLCILLCGNFSVASKLRIMISAISHHVQLFVFSSEECRTKTFSSSTVFSTRHMVGRCSFMHPKSLCDIC